MTHVNSNHAVETRWRSLEQVLGSEGARQIEDCVALVSNRRLTNTAETVIPRSVFCQMLHVSPVAKTRQAILGGEHDRYFVHSLDSVLEEVDSLKALGVDKFYLQLSPDPNASPLQRIGDFANVILHLKDRFGNEIKLISDPQALCMNPDLKWGIKRPDGTIDAVKTLELIAASAESFAQAGSEGYMTIGRINCEARVARAALDKANRGTRLYAFSTNSETPNAYFDKTSQDISKAQTGQKLLVGNADEMALRALLDIQEGVDVVLQKPFENFHLIGLIQRIVDGVYPVETLLLRPHIQDMMRANPSLFKDGPMAALRAGNKLQTAKVGGYEVSGSYAISKLIEDRHSPALSWAMLHEAFVNALNASEGKLDVLVARSVSWYLRTGQQLDPDKALAAPGLPV